MFKINEFMNQLEKINWFENSGTTSDKYHLIYSIFEAYDDWNQKMLEVWEPNICELEKKAQKVIGDLQIDEIFELISNAVNDRLWEKYCAFVERCNLQEECGLDNEIIGFVIRDISWACIEFCMDINGFFTLLLDVYKTGYFPCSWLGTYPEGKFVVM